MTQLRHLSLHVEEPNPDEYLWTIMESSDETNGWIEIDSAIHGHPTWKQAWIAGTVAYHLRIVDDRVGPRAIDERLSR